MSDPEKKILDATGKQRAAVEPLRGKTVMVTRPRAQSGEITAMLERLGASVVHCPTIETIEPSSWEPLDAAIERLSSYDWLVFTSANGARFFFRRLAEWRKGTVDLPAKLIICAIGLATAQALKAAGARASLIAKDSKAEGALQAIIEQVGGEEKIRGLRFLIPRARVARDVLPVELTKLGAEVDAVEAYQTVKPDADGESVARLFIEGSIDAITFTSSSTVRNFASLVAMKDLSQLLRRTIAGCIGPVTAETAAEHGITNIVQPEVYTTIALVEVIARAMAEND